MTDAAETEAPEVAPDLHGLIENGELLRRREATGEGANVQVREIPSTGEPIPVLLGRS